MYILSVKEAKTCSIPAKFLGKRVIQDTLKSSRSCIVLVTDVVLYNANTVLLV